MNMEYDLELERVAKEIKKSRAKNVCIQLPDGLKPEAGKISKELEKKTGANIMIWAGSCYGACDVPLSVENLGVDLLVQWGHSEWE
jgi:diphthamide biosynthesis enzyme Dph1/Dph2-like protein